MRMILPYGFTVFCDDVRQEIHGKRTFVGTYSGNIVVHAPTTPVSLPMFSFAITLFEPHELVRARDFSIPLAVYLPGDRPDEPTISGEFPDNREAMLPLLDNLPLPAESELDLGPRVMRTDVVITMGPLVLKQPGFIFVRAKYRGETLRLGSLNVTITEAQAT